MFDIEEFFKNYLLKTKDKEKGVVFTPYNIVNKMIELCDIDPSTKIVEPSFGKGNFIFGIFEYLYNKFNLKPEQLLDMLLIELNNSYIQEFKKLFKIYFKEKFNFTIKQDFNFDNNFLNYDALFFEENKNYLKLNQIRYDLTIGNPPYIKIQLLEESYKNKIKENFNYLKKGNVDIYFAFIEKFQKLTNQLCFITPNGFLKTKSGKQIKDLVLNNCSHLINLEKEKSFKNANVFCVIFKLNNKDNKQVYYSEKLEESFKNFEKMKFIKKFQDNEFKNQLNKETNNLNKYKVFSQIATLFDKGFIFDFENLIKEDENYFWFSSKILNNKTIQIEKEMLMDFYKITKINKKYKILFPYERKNEKFKILEEDIVKELYPYAYQYLLEIKSFLLQRDKGKTEKYESWFAYGRKQGLNLFNEEKIYLAIPLLISEKTKATLIEKSNFLFTSGFVVECDKKLSYDLIENFNKHIFNFVKKYGNYYQGDYYSINKQQLEVFLTI